MQMVLIQFKTYNNEPRDICVVRNKPTADKYVEALVKKYPSYTTGEFIYKKIKYIKEVKE